MVPTAANGEPAFAAYSRKDANSPWTAHSIHVLMLKQKIISRLTLFYKPDGPRLFDAFGLPLAAGVTKSAIDLGTGQQAAHQRASGAWAVDPLRAWILINKTVHRRAGSAAGRVHP